MRLTKIDKVDQLIFFQILFAVTMAVGLVAFALFYENTTEAEKAILIFVQSFLMIRITIIQRQVIGLTEASSKN